MPIFHYLLRILRKRFDFIIPASLLLVSQIPYWIKPVWPEHYTLVTFMNFYSFYNELFLHHDILRWMPFGSYGIQANFWQLHQLTPISYATMLLGKLTQFRDVRVAFSVSIFLEQLVFLIGLYLVSTRFYRNRFVTLFVCLSGALNTVWTYELFWNLRIFYLLPFILYFLTRFSDTSQSVYFWLWALLLTISIIGNLPYFIPLNFLISAIFLAVLFFKKQLTVREFMPNSQRSSLVFAGFLLLFSAIVYFTLNSFNGIVVFKPDRNQDAFFSTDISHFLTFAKAYWTDYQEFFSATFGRSRDHSKYFGHIPILMAIVGVFFVRKRVLLACSASALFLLVFSLGDSTPVAGMIYHAFPPIRIFRYVGQVGALIKFFLILMSGFGFQYFLSVWQRREGPRVFLQRQRVLLVGVAFFVFLIVMQNSNKFGDWPEHFAFNIVMLSVFLLILCSSRFNSKIKLIAISLVLVDLFWFQNLVFKKALDYQIAPPKEFYEIFNYQFQSTRLSAPRDAMDFRTRKAVKYIDSIRGLWVEGYDFAKFDPCIPFRPAIFQSRPVFNLTKEIFQTEAPLGEYLSSFKEFVDHPKLPSFLNALGCSEDKIKFSAHPIFASNLHEAKLLVGKWPYIHLNPVIETQNEQENKIVSPTLAIESSGKVERISQFSANRLAVDVNVVSPTGSWLYYPDSYHSGWHASVDGIKTTIARANLAFKSLFVPQGRHHVEFFFFDGLNSVISVFMAICGLLFCMFLTMLVARLFL